MKNIVHIKNMVCPRCITTVEEIFKELNIEVLAIQLGEVSSLMEINESQKVQLEKDTCCSRSAVSCIWYFIIANDCSSSYEF